MQYWDTEYKVPDILERIGHTKTNVLYVTNHKEEIMNCLTHFMRFQSGEILSQGKKEEVSRRDFIPPVSPTTPKGQERKERAENFELLKKVERLFDFMFQFSS